MTKKLRSSRGVSLLEVTAAMAILIATVFMVTVQDTSSAMQAKRDARLAVALLWLENEAALMRSSLPPWFEVPYAEPHLALYTNAVFGEPRVYENVSLLGDTTRFAGVGQLSDVLDRDAMDNLGNQFTNAVVRRTLIERRADGYDGMVFDTYQVEVDIPHTLRTDTPDEVETLRRTVRRVFTDDDVVPVP